MKKIGIFGGSFDPVTNAHLKIMELARKYVDEVWVMPVESNHLFGKELSPAEDRKEMLYLAIKQRERVSIVNDNDGSTYNLMNSMKAANKNCEFYIIIGSDQAQEITKWHEYEKLCKENKFLIFMREKNFDLDLTLFGNGVLISDESLVNTGSSSEARKILWGLKEDFVNDDLLESLDFCPKEAIEYAIENRVYRRKDICYEGKHLHMFKKDGWEYASRSKQRPVVICSVENLTDPGDPMIVLTRQYRIPIGKDVFERPAGIIDEGETAAEAAVRELREETGYIGKVLNISGPFPTSPGLSDEMCYIAEMKVVGVDEQDLQDEEKIKVVSISINRIKDFVRTYGEENAKSVIEAKTYIWLCGVSRDYIGEAY